MKPNNQLNLRGIFPLLVLFFVLQSCNVYHSPSYSIDKAIEKQKKIKILTKDLQSYEFEYITKDGEELIGHAKTKSNTAELLKDDIIAVNEEEKMASIKIDRTQVQEIKVKNGAASTGANIGTGVGIAAIVAVVGFAVLIALAF